MLQCNEIPKDEVSTRNLGQIRFTCDWQCCLSKLLQIEICGRYFFFFSVHIFMYACMSLIFFLFTVFYFFLPHFPYLSNTYITAITDVMILLLVLMSLRFFFRTNLLSSILFFIFKLQRFCISLVFLYYLNYIILLLIIASCVVVYVTLPVHNILFLYISFFVRAINIIIQIFHDFSVY